MTNPANIPLIQFRNASVRKGTKYILDRITGTISQGQHTVILGPNGCGKTTLLKLLTLQEYPCWSDATEPQLTILGEERWNAFELRKQLGIVSGDLTNKFLTDFSSAQLTGLDAVLTGFFASRELFDWTPVDDAMRNAAYKALQRMHAERLSDQSLETMSTGEQRRVIIARALVHQPHTLVLDEPTNGLDVVAAADLLNSLERLASEGVTLIVVTHHVDEIPRATQQVILLKAGRLFASGTPEAMFQSARLSELFDRPVMLNGKLSEGNLRLSIEKE